MVVDTDGAAAHACAHATHANANDRTEDLTVTQNAHR